MMTANIARAHTLPVKSLLGGDKAMYYVKYCCSIRHNLPFIPNFIVLLLL